MRLLIFLIWATCVVNSEAKLKVVKYVYQRDMSEHCRRRVMPSVFLGNHVVEANSKILHFSQLEVPYSCFISIRTETGGNIILVVQVDSHPAECSKERTMESPVKVFGMGETFGGYWGPLPDSILSTSTPLVEKYYTLKTTKMEKDSFDEKNIKSVDELFSDEGSISAHEGPPTQSPPPTGDRRDYIREMIPIINITGRLVKTNQEPVRAFAVDDTFDLFYNVKRDPDKKYVSTMLPLMQFSAAERQSEGRRSEGDGASGGNTSTPEPRFDFEFDFGGFTLDPRLIFPLPGTKPVVLGKRYRPSVNKRLNFKKNKGKLFSAKGSPPAFSKKQSTKVNDSWHYIENLFKNLSDSNGEQVEKENRSETERFSALLQRVADWQHNYSAYLAPNLTLNNPLFFNKLHKINQTSGTSTSPALGITDTTTRGHSVNQINKNHYKSNNKKISTKENVINKESTILIPDLYSERVTRLIQVSAETRSTSPQTLGTSTQISTGIPISYLSHNITEAAIATIQEVTASVSRINDKILNIRSNTTEKYVVSKDSVTKSGHTKTQTEITSKTIENQNAEGPTDKYFTMTLSPVTGSMANHASWENLVQVAPKIAGILNHNVTSTKPFGRMRDRKLALPKKHKGRPRRRRRRRRRRRSVQAIQIEHARPHNLTTDPDVMTTPEAMYNFVDMQDFAQLVELQDDEIQGHLALRYMRRFVGPTMFDLCTSQSSVTQHVLFFNTSRIVLALNNFTLKRMTVIATPARWLPFSGQRCNINSLECQVAGKRVCVNKLTACDGVPNCGAMDIYDEDRLQCGAGNGLQHNVYLAAFTFLAVLLTMLYTVHYWLKRCVPKVSEAFFIYTDGTENILYLDSVMRSPLDNDIGTSMYHGNYFEDILAIDNRSGRKKKGIFRRMFGYCCGKKKKIDDFEMVDMDLMDGFQPRDHEFSFPEIELNNLTHPPGVEIAVQTGDSLEMNYREGVEERESMWFFDRLNAAAIQARHRKESIDPRAGFRDIRIHNEHDEDEIDRRNSENSELSMLKFLREAKLSSEHWDSHQQPSIKEEPDKEKELKCTIYDRSAMQLQSYTSPENFNQLPPESLKDIIAGTPYELNIPLVSQEPLAIPGPSTLASGPRRIRFNDNLTTIPQEEDQGNIVPDKNQMQAQEVTEVQPSPAGSGRDFRRFWTSNKSKKEKTKQRKHLTMN